MHYLQKHVIDELRIRGDSRYTDLMPDAVESGLFRYHLKELEKRGLLTKVSRGRYKLSNKGLLLADSLSLNKHTAEKHQNSLPMCWWKTTYSTGS